MAVCLGLLGDHINCIILTNRSGDSNICLRVSLYALKVWSCHVKTLSIITRVTIGFISCTHGVRNTAIDLHKGPNTVMMIAVGADVFFNTRS